jgi:hypothetical protein
VTDFLPWRFARPLGVTVSFLSAAAADELDQLVNWRKSLGQQLENQREGSSLRPLTPSFTAASSLTRPYPIAQGVKT